MKRVLSLLCAVTMILTMCSFYMGEALSVAAEDAAPEASAEDIVWIETYEQLIAEMAKDTNAGMTLKFKNDIKASDWEFTPVDTATKTVTGTLGDTTVTINVDTDNAAFATIEGGELGANTVCAKPLANGVNIDGNGFSITGMHIVGATNTSYAYLISSIGSNSTVKNVKFKNCVFVSGSAKIAPLAGNVYGKVIDCETDASVTIASRYTGGGEINIGGFIVEPFMQGVGGYNKDMTLQDYYDGLMGEYKVTSISLIDGCVNNATILVTRTDSGADNTSDGKALNVGGIAARVRGGIFRNCVNNADITTYGKVYGLGGIVGLCDPVDNVVGYPRIVNIYNCANHGNIKSVTNWKSNAAGGIVGKLDTYWATGGQFNLANCYNSGELDCTYFSISESERTAHGAAFGMIGYYSEANGTQWIGGTKAEDGGYQLRSIFYGGTAFNFIKTSEAPYTTATRDNKMAYNSLTGSRGSFSFSEIYSAPDNVSSEEMFGEDDVKTILNVSCKYFDGAKSWTTNEAGDPTVNQSSARAGAAVEIGTQAQLEQFRDMFKYCEELGSEMTLSAVLTNDIDLNEGYTFGYDADKKAGTITKDDVTYYLGYGENDLVAGAIYESDLSTTTTAIAPYQWTAFQSATTSSSDLTTAKEKKVTMTLDGAGYTIKGLYLNGTGDLGFAGVVNNVHFENLTLDGLIVSTTGGSIAAFIPYTSNDTTIKNCVSNVNILVNRTTGTSVAGFVAKLGVDRSKAWMLERMPNRIVYVTGCVNNGDIYVYGTTGQSDKAAGIVAHMFSGEVSYCTNTGNIDIDYSWGVAGVVGHIEAGTTWGITSAAYGSDKSDWGTGKNGYASGSNISAPYQTTIRVIGNTNVGKLTIVSANRKASVLTHNTCWVSHGAWGLVSSTYAYTQPPLIVPSECIIQYNVGETDSVATAVNSRHDSWAYGSYVWAGGATLSIGTLFQDSCTNNVTVASTTMAARYNALASVYNAASIYDRGYMMWLDYDYTTKAIPHPVKFESAAKAVEGLTVSVVDSKLQLGVGNAEALMLLNDTVNYITTAPAVVAGVKVNNIYDVYNIAADAATDKTNVETYLLAVTGKEADARYTSLKDVTVKLTADIDLGGAEWTPLGDDVPYFNVAYNNNSAWSATPGATYIDPVYGFAGTFDGNSKTISNFKFSRDNGVGFFGSTANNSVIKNLTFSNVNIEGGKFVAIFACHSRSQINSVVVDDTCSVTATGDHVAGLIAQQYSNSSKIESCINYADVTSADAYVGGIVAKYFNGSLNNCINYGTIKSTLSSDTTGFVGGVGGYVFSNWDSFTGNKNYGQVYAPDAAFVGGVMGCYNHLVGSANGANNLYNNNFYNEGAVTGGKYVGGIIGNDYSGEASEHFTGFVNKGAVVGKNNVGGIFGYVTSGDVQSGVNHGTVNGTTYTAGIVGSMTGTTVQNCENTETAIITSEQTGGINAYTYIAGIVSEIQNKSNVITCVNRAKIYSADAVRAAGIVSAIAGGTKTKIEGNVNYGYVEALNRASGIVGSVNSGAVVLIKGNVNYADITNPKSLNVAEGTAGIVAEKQSNTNTEICYNVNFGKITPAHGYNAGGIIGRPFGTATVYGPTIYGNIDISARSVISTSAEYGFAAYNYIPGKTSNVTLIDGAAVTTEQFKFGQVADIINNIAFTANNFISTSDSYLYAEGSNEKLAPKGTFTANVTAENYVAPAGFEEDYMVQEIGVDEYPLPKLAATIIYADREITAPQGAVTTAPAAPATTGSEKFVGYIDYDRNLYKANQPIEGGEKYLYPITVDFYTAYGAGVRTTDPMGIRFQTLVKDNLGMLNDAAIYEDFGTVILPTEYVDAMMNDAGTYGNKFDVQAIKDNHVQHIDIENNGWADPSFASVEVKEGYNTFMGSIVRIKENNLKKDFSGASYLKVKYAGDEDYSYITANWQTVSTNSETFVDGANYDKDANSRSIVTIANKALDQGGLSPAVQEYLNGIIEQAAALA